ncbi:MAG: hypothetical protein JXA33_21185 [Anaerolineae bacterium]|nr:hypothetical protein [Anaerolineae bacterium]
MLKRLSLITMMILSLIFAPSVLAQGPFEPQHSDPMWQTTYWNNTTLSGNPALQREEGNINYDWGTGSPASSVNSDYFSARWTRYIDVTPGSYRFSVTSDDGVRIWVDNNLIIDAWYEHGAQTFTADTYMGSGHHLIKVEYYEQAGFAVLQLQWQFTGSTPPPATTGDWLAEYFNNITLGGSPVLTRQESAVNYNWGFNSPVPGTVSSDRFSVRWTRTMNMSAAMYHFTLTIDDGARLWVNGHLLVDGWIDQATTTYTGDIYLDGSITIELQYYENSGQATAQLAWSPNGGNTSPYPTPPPSSGTVVVDDTDWNFVKNGSETGWRVAYEGYNGRLTWTYNNDTTRPNYNWAQWNPNLTSGYYEVFVFIPYRYTTTASARYWISHADGKTLRIVDQSTTGDQWVSLGTYRFSGSSGDYVTLADVTFEDYRTRLIAFDAMKWVPR